VRIGGRAARLFDGGGGQGGLAVPGLADLSSAATASNHFDWDINRGGGGGYLVDLGPELWETGSGGPGGGAAGDGVGTALSVEVLLRFDPVPIFAPAEVNVKTRPMRGGRGGWKETRRDNHPTTRFQLC
jgi:hypothetical protein